MKTCPKCKVQKPHEDFGKNRCSYDGFQTYCRGCRKTIDAKFYSQRIGEKRDRYTSQQKRRIQQMQENVLKYLQEHPCIDCGENDPIVLEFDHVRGVKIREVSQVVRTWCWQRILQEISKCVIRCANCHRRKTARQFETSKYKALLAQSVEQSPRKG